ncbi:MAG: alpha/beta hydrolase family protein [Vulcanimicrobiota bacterium]
MTSLDIPRICIILILMAVISFAPLPVSAKEAPVPGELVSWKLIGHYSKPKIDSIFTPGFINNLLPKVDGESMIPGPAENAVNACLVEYRTTTTDGNVVIASGVLLVPEHASGPLPLLSYQHGTILDRKKSPSYLNACTETVLMLYIFAAHGYVVSMPDYIGEGRSTAMHTYLVAGYEASASLDMLKASKQLCSKLGVALSDKLFLAGYSQGGHSTMALQRLLEKEHRTDFPVTASAPMAGPYNLYYLWSKWIDRPCDLSSAVMARMVLAYDKVYNLKMPMGKVFRPPYDRHVASILDGNHRDEEIYSRLPHNPTKLFTQKFLKEVSDGAHPFYRVMKTNNTYEWYPEAPTILYHGRKDDVVPYEVSKIAYYYMKHRCNQVQMCNVGDFTHMTAVFPAFLAVKRWFDGYTK